MFTGIIQSTGRVASTDSTEGGRRLVIEAPDWAHAPKPGDSIAVSGCCLTSIDGRLAFDVISETLNKTTLGDLAPGDRVNLEHACRPDSFLDGHIVQGHVDGVGEVAAVQDDPADWRVRIRPPAGLMEFVSPKGSVTVDGVSLTVADLDPETFEIALIPTTLDLTTLRDLTPGARVNLEMDVISKTVVHWLRTWGPGNAPSR
ncbi:riboflavin synthase [Pyruvatibacter sp.]|uniref:riboflavin synthase n=1 Tax=Pyruvatibacter sp. TaxID=1981328 RepID=UPI0032EBD377